MEFDQSGLRSAKVHRTAALAELQHLSLYCSPTFTNGLLHRGAHEAFYECPRGVLRSKAVPLLRRKGAHEEGPEDCRLDGRPVGLCGSAQKRELIPVQRQCLGVLEKMPVET